MADAKEAAEHKTADKKRFCNKCYGSDYPNIYYRTNKTSLIDSVSCNTEIYKALLFVKVYSYLPKYLFSRPSNALPCLASSWVFCCFSIVYSNFSKVKSQKAHFESHFQNKSVIFFIWCVFM